ncbi:MAG: MFS transporter [Calditrichaceae bacterium]
MNNNDQKLSLREKLSYGFGDLASVLYWQTFMLYFTFFYTDIFLIPAAAAATLFLLSRLWDGINDPLMGIIADRTETKWGKFRPYMLWMSIPFAVMGVLTFTVPDFGPDGKLFWAYATFLGIMMLYTAINIPYTALLGVISGDSLERTKVSSVKFLFAFGAGIIVSATLLPMAKSLGGNDTSIIDAKINNQTLKVEEAGNGNAKIILTAVDPEGKEGRLEFSVLVNPKDNNMPVLVNPLPTQNLEAGFKKQSIDISNVFYGKDKRKFEYSVSNDNEDVVDTKVKNDNLIIVEKGIGNAKITLTARDADWGSEFQEFYINVSRAGNAIPVISDTIQVIKFENKLEKKEINLSDIFTDPDGDALSYTAISENLKIIDPQIKDSLLSFVESETGKCDVEIIARDNNGGQVIDTVSFLIYSKDDNPPFINKEIANMVKSAGFGNFNIDISNAFVDMEGEPLDFKVEIINYAKGWQFSFIFYGIAFVIFFFIAFIGTKERIHPPKSQETSIGKDLKELVTNKPWLILLATTITFILFVAAKGSVTVHYFKYVITSQKLALPFLGADTYDFETLTSAYNTIGQIASLIGVLLVSWFAKIVGKKKAFIIIFVIAVFSTGIVYFLTAKQLGWIFFLSLNGLILLFTLIPAGLGLLSMAICFIYPLNDNRVAEIEAELKVRREADGTGELQPE